MTWSGPEDPPPIAIVNETCFASSWSYNGGASADNDLGDTVYTTDTQTPPFHARSTGYAGGSYVNHYWVKENPGWSFPVYCSPSASGAGPSAAASVSYAVVATPVFLSVSGVLSPTDKRLMIGQKLSAEVVGCESFESEFDTYDWHVSAGAPFSAYSANDSAATYTAWMSPNTRSMFCHFAQPSGTITVSVEVTLANLGVSFDLEDQVQAVPPSFSTTLVLDSPELVAGAYPNFVVNHTDPTELVLWGAQHDSKTRGIFYKGQVTTPSDFFTTYLGETVKGLWAFTQIVTASSSWYQLENLDYYDWSANFSNDKYLDKTHPYGSWFMADSSEHYTNDTPGVGLGPGCIQISAADSFDLYTIHMPPKFDSLQVPLEKYAWNWNGLGQKSSSTPPWTVSGAASKSGPTTYPAHPIWSKNITSLQSAGYVKR